MEISASDVEFEFYAESGVFSKENLVEKRLQRECGNRRLHNNTIVEWKILNIIPASVQSIDTNKVRVYVTNTEALIVPMLRIQSVLPKI